MKHGLGGYNNGKCKCDICRAAACAWQKSFREHGKPGMCNFCGGYGLYANGVCFKHYSMLMRLVKKGTRTREELVVGGYLNH